MPQLEMPWRGGLLARRRRRSAHYRTGRFRRGLRAEAVDQAEQVDLALCVPTRAKAATLDRQRRQRRLVLLQIDMGVGQLDLVQREH